MERALINLRPEPAGPHRATSDRRERAFRLVGLRPGRYAAEIRDRAMISATLTLVFLRRDRLRSVVGRRPKRELLEHAMAPPPTTPN